jgi:outer membrane protein OmpA-like peptidoglycan-associated protein
MTVRMRSVAAVALSSLVSLSVVARASADEPNPNPDPNAKAPEAAPAGGSRLQQHLSAVAQGHDADLSRYVADEKAPLPRAFPITGISFDFNQVEPTAGSADSISALADVMSNHPNARLRIEGSTELGTLPKGNVDLALGRANAVKAELVKKGIAADRITTALAPEVLGWRGVIVVVQNR